MTTIVESDTVDDWRTRQRLAGCRITGAGSTESDMAQEAARFYVRLRSAGWTRTPDPQDAPNESSLRLRRGETDCLFSLYQGVLLQTDAELQVLAAHTPAPNETTRFQVLALCVPAIPAVDR